MKTEIHDLLIDLKAAVAIGQPESIRAAISGLYTLPDVASNRRLRASFVLQNLVPLGEQLGKARLPEAFFETLLQDPHAAIRAIAASALCIRFTNGNSEAGDSLQKAGLDERSEVRAAIAATLAKTLAASNAGSIIRLCETWLKHPSHKLQETARTVLAQRSHDAGKKSGR